MKAYKPSLFRISKYFTYLGYLMEFIHCRDYESLFASFRYVITHRGPAHDYIASSKLGRFQIRKGTNDFQFINRAYERKIKDFIEKNMDSFDVFIDVGACIGEYCIWLASHGKKCVAVEPVNYQALERNVALNGMEGKIRVLKCGLGDKQERVYFFRHSDATSSSYMERNSSLAPNTDVDTLDSIAAKLNIQKSDRILIKLDVEGMEKEVISGGRNFIANHQHLTFIYEDHIVENFANDKALQSISDFTCLYLDPVTD